MYEKSTIFYPNVSLTNIGKVPGQYKSDTSCLINETMTELQNDKCQVAAIRINTHKMVHWIGFSFVFPSCQFSLHFDLF